LPGHTAIITLLLIGIGTSTWQAVRATAAESQVKTHLQEAIRQTVRAKDAENLANERLAKITDEKKRADNASAVANAVNDFLLNDLLRQAGSTAQADSLAVPNPNLTMKEALDRASERISRRANSMCAGIPKPPPRMVRSVLFR
jgi:hypothetical protein